MDLDSSSEDGVDWALNFVGDVIEGILDGTTTHIPSGAEHNLAKEDEEDEDAQSETDDTEEGSVIGGAPSKRPDLDDYAWVDQVPQVRLSVRPPSPDRPWQYKSYDFGISRIIKEVERRGKIAYVVETRDHRRLELPFQYVTKSSDGRRALRSYQQASGSGANSSVFELSMAPVLRTREPPRKRVNFIDTTQLGLSDDDEQESENASTDNEEDDEDDISDRPRRPGRRLVNRKQQNPTRETRITNKPKVSYNYGPIQSDDESGGDSRPIRKRKRVEPQYELMDDPDRRRSGRQRTSKTMREVGENEIDEIEVQQSAGPKATGAKESFRKLDTQNEFRKRHCMTCDTCATMGDSLERGALIFCQSCSLSYHKACLGHRTNREHLVTKIGDGDFVMQCRRCVEMPRRKEKTAPHHGRCGSCKKSGHASKPFRPRKTPSEEQKEREANNDQDPSYSVSPELINNVQNVMFRCTKCFQAFHFHHLPSKQENPLELDEVDQKAGHRFSEYSETWQCHECEDVPAYPPSLVRKATPGGLVAWRPISTANYISGQTVDQVNEDDKEYLVKWHHMSHYKCQWKPGPWVWGVVSSGTKNSFFKRENNTPTMTTEEAIPEDWLRIDIIFSVKYNNVVQAKIEEVDIARIKEVSRCYVKFKGLSYEEAVWTDPPDREETERYDDFSAAYVDYVRGQYIRMPTQKKVSTELQKLRAAGHEERTPIFEKKLYLKEQTEELTGGKLMEYQLDGVNWMLFQWFKEQNAILADEMGLGKTIQVVGFLSALKERMHLCPFLIVVPNATCANWRREIKLWAPSLRVVTYFGSAKAKELSMEYELFGDRSENPKGGMPAAHELRCHVVVTSYEAAGDPENQGFFKRMNWQALIVDEGQRLKNDKTQLYGFLSAVKVPFRVLLSGTPLQNNQRELFNLLHFLDRTMNAEALEKEYENLDSALIKKLHDLIRPFFLRRTKAEVLTFLPPMGQVIVPVTMTPLQKQLYKSIISKNVELVKAVMGKRDADNKGKHISGLKNVLMQLRKVLCHPYVYSIEVEEKTKEKLVSHQQLVAASAKLILLEMMLPKLKERGHRVLIFSQFLENLTIVEDCLDGMEMPYLRLDGGLGSLEKQKVIDKFNAPNSEVFCMLLSTRAGGVGINLATADTVIIMDPDFNPHQDIQAIARAHRIGQKNKVLVFQLMTRDTAEEKIMQIGKKKMVLDHLVIEQMENDEGTGDDFDSILQYGAKALFDEEDSTEDIVYDNASIEKLIDRSHIEATLPAGKDTTVEAQFSFARIWQNDAAKMGGELKITDDDNASADPALWDKILALRAKDAEEARLRREAELGRGRRNRTTINYGQDVVQHIDRDSDTDFADKDGNESDDDRGSLMDGVEQADATELSQETSQLASAPAAAKGLRSKYFAPPTDNRSMPQSTSSSVVPPDAVLKSNGPQSDFAVPRTAISSKSLFKPKPVSGSRTFVRAEVVRPKVMPADPHQLPCLACKDMYGHHETGDCPIKRAGTEYCNLCGLAHFGYQRTCPHLNSETQVRLMLEALKHSPEDPELVRQARVKLQGIKGTIVQKKKKEQQQRMGTFSASGGAAPGPLNAISANIQAPAAAASPYDTSVPSARNAYPGGVFTTGWSPLNNFAGQQAATRPPQNGTQSNGSGAQTGPRPGANVGHARNHAQQHGGQSRAQASPPAGYNPYRVQ